MSINYNRLFDRIRVYAGPFGFGENFKATIDNQTLAGNDVLCDEILDSDNMARLHDLGETFKSSIDSSILSYGAELDQYLRTEGRDEAQSSGQTPKDVATDIVTFMIRDSQTVLTNILGNTQDIDSAGDGTINTFTQTQITRNDTITLTCTTAQTPSVDALFSVRSKIEANLAGIFVKADGVTSHDDAFFGKNLGIGSLIINGGTTGNEWAVSDQITIITTSDERSILLIVWRDKYGLEFPTSATPTISNLFIPNVETFPLNPVDGQEVILEGVRYFFDATTDEWVESCL